MTKTERVEAAVAGGRVDRVPVAAWRHFIPEETSPSRFVQATLDFQNRYDWDWIKINPRATYYAEAWGNRYDYDSYSGVFPDLVSSPVSGLLSKIMELRTSNPIFTREIRVVRSLRKSLRDVPIIQTVFSPLSVLAFLVTETGEQRSQVGSSSVYPRLLALLRDEPAAARSALSAIAATLAGYARKTIQSGADGIFFAIVKLAREGVLTRAELDEFERPFDLEVLEGAKKGWLNVLHVCGPEVFLDAVRTYPVHAINWAAVGQSNPSIGDEMRPGGPAVMGGVDEVHTLLEAGAEGVVAEARRAIRSATDAAEGARRFLLAPGCGVAMETSDAALRALRSAVEE